MKLKKGGKLKTTGNARKEVTSNSMLKPEAAKPGLLGNKGLHEASNAKKGKGGC